jgi:hypothetical protein
MTRCLNCGLTLTSDHGERLHEANFTSGLPHFNTNTLRDEPNPYRPNAGVVWARCTPCFTVATRRLAPMQTMRDDMTTEELLAEAAYRRLFQSPQDEARADTHEEEE